MSSVIAALLAAAIGVGALTAGFIAGVWAYAKIHEHFFGKVEEQVKRRVHLALLAEREKKSKLDEVRRNIVQQWGPDLSSKHQAVIDEEIEQVLGATRKRN